MNPSVRVLGWHQRLRWRAAVIVLLALMVAGCDDDDSSQNPGSDTSTGSGSTVTGSERLAWDQQASSLQAVNSYRFSLFVDGTSAGLLSASCTGISSFGTFTCTAPLPSLPGGVHVVAVRTTDPAGQSSPLSAGLTINVQAATSRSMSMAMSQMLERAVMNLAQVCFGDGPGKGCYQLNRIATNLVQPEHPTEMPDGRLVVLDQGVPLEISEGSVRPLAADVPRGSRIAAMSVPRDSTTTREVYAVEVVETRRARTAAVVRFRDVAGVLGQRAVIVPAIPLPREGDPALLVEDKVLVAVPQAGDTGAGPGVILSYERSGRAAGRSLGSPALAWGPSRPSLLTTSAGRITIGGVAPGVFVLGTLAPGATTPVSTAVTRSLAASGGVRAIARTPQLALFAAGDGSAYIGAASDANAPLSVQKIDTRGAVITGIATTRRGTIVATARLPLPSVSAGRVYELTPVRN